MTNNLKAITSSAGSRTKILPVTKAQPWDTPTYKKPTIQHIIDEMIASRIDSIIIITGRNKRTLEDHFDKSYELEYIIQRVGNNRDPKILWAGIQFSFFSFINFNLDNMPIIHYGAANILLNASHKEVTVTEIYFTIPISMW